MKRVVVLFFFLSALNFSNSIEPQYGIHKSVVVIDPDDRRNIRGHIHMAMMWGEILEPPALYPRYLINLKDAVHRWTKIEVTLNRAITLGSPRLHKMPFVYITASEGFELTPIEKKNVKEFFKNGGFMILENSKPTFLISPPEESFRRLLYDALGPNAQSGPLPWNHPIYHSFFDFPYGGPSGNLCRGCRGFYFDGVWLDGRLVAVLSNMGYVARWNDISNNDPQLRFGVNMVVYALTRFNNHARN